MTILIVYIAVMTFVVGVVLAIVHETKEIVYPKEKVSLDVKQIQFESKWEKEMIAAFATNLEKGLTATELEIEIYGHKLEGMSGFYITIELKQKLAALLQKGILETNGEKHIRISRSFIDKHSGALTVVNGGNLTMVNKDA